VTDCAYNDAPSFSLVLSNRETGAITIAHAPNLSLWIVIVAGALIWVWHLRARRNDDRRHRIELMDRMLRTPSA
jgi:hypothetical protein